MCCSAISARNGPTGNRSVSPRPKSKLDALGIKIGLLYYTQGPYDFVDVVDVPNAEALLAFSVWYSAQGLGRIQSMPAFDAKTFETALKKAAD